MTSTSAGSAALRPDQIVEAGLAASSTDGCVVVVQSTSEANIRWANTTGTTNGMATSLDFFVVAVVGGSAATVSGSIADAASAPGVAAVVRAAEEAARAVSGGTPSRDAMALYGTADGEAAQVDADFADGPAATSFQVYDCLIDGLAAAFDTARSEGQQLYGFARHDVTTIHLGTSTGIRRRWVQPTGTFELNAKSADLTRSTWAGQSTEDFTDVNVAGMHASLTQRLAWAERRIDLAPGRYETVLPPTSVADFMIYLAWSAAARPAHDGRSAFSAKSGTRIGERLTERPMTLFADPAHPTLRCAPFVATAHSSDDVSVFDNGAPAGRLHLIADGAIAGLIQTRASAADYGAPFTPVVDNLVLTGGEPGRSTEDLVRGVERGLLVTSLWYIREVDPATLLLTGLTRDGVYLVEGGEVVGVVNNFRFNMSPLDVLRHAADVGETERCLSREWSDWFTRTEMPPIRVDGFHMSSVSQAL